MHSQRWTSGYRRLILVGIVWTGMSVFSGVYAQKPPPSPPPDGQHPGDQHAPPRDVRGKRKRPRFHGPAAFHHSERHTSVTLAMARKFMMAELDRVPSLKSKIRRIGEIQQQRTVLQRERVRLAQDEGLDRRKTLELFHESLKKDDQLSNELKQVVKDLLDSAPRIHAEIETRCKQIQARLDQLKSDTTTTGSEETKNLNRALRLYAFWNSRMQSLKENPERVDLLMRFMRGWSTDGHEHARMKLENRLEDLRREQQECDRRLNQIDEEMQDVRDNLKKIDSGEWQPADSIRLRHLSHHDNRTTASKQRK